MKKILLSLSLCFTFLFCDIPHVHAEEFYYKEVIEVIDEASSRATSTKTAKKTGYYANGSTILWSVTVTGTFTYNGSTSRCTNSSVTASSNDSRWKIVSKSSSKSGSTAKATATAKCYLNSLVIDTKTQTVSLTCSPTGKLS